MYEIEKLLLDDIVKYSNGKLNESFTEKYNESNFDNPTIFIETLVLELLATYKQFENFPLMFANLLGDYTEEKDIDFAQIIKRCRWNLLKSLKNNLLYK